MELKTVYFEKAGPDNTEVTLKVAKKRATELGIKTVLVASTRGDTAVRAAQVLKGFRVVAVSHGMGWKEPDVQPFTEANRKAFEKLGGIVLITGHSFAGVSRSLRTQFNTYTIGDIIANVLCIFGYGMKVVAEIAMMAADAGVVRCDEDVMCVTGTGKGADTAVVLTPVNSHRFFTMKIKEILCKPHF